MVNRDGFLKLAYSRTLNRNDGSRSFHPLSLVREKCPQLVIDAFVNIVNENK